MDGIDKIRSSLKELLKDKEIIARCELLNRTYDFVRNAKLTSEEKEELQKMVGSEIASGIFASMMSGSPIFFDLPRVDTCTLINGRIFHFLHTKSYSKQDFDNAYRKFLAALPELKSILQQNLMSLLIDFMAGADYMLVKTGANEARFEAGDRKINAQVFTSIELVDLGKCRHDKEDCDCVILVPSSESLEPFVHLYREKSDAFEAEKIQIWIANMEQGAVDPFIGYTTDMDIYNQFKNPRLAQMVRSHWKR